MRLVDGELEQREANIAIEQRAVETVSRVERLERNGLESLERFRLERAAKLKTLSKGGYAKVGLALALASDPEVLILDEPTSGLDLFTRREFLSSMVELACEGRTILTPLFNSSAGVTVIVSAGDVGIAAVVQTSVRVDCALPLAAQAPAPVPTQRTGIAGPDTGNGGYLGQNSSNSFPMWAVLALVLGSVTLIAGGLVTRRAGK